MIDKYALIIFDWDGTLVDSVPNIVKALSRAAGDSGLPLLDDADYRGVIGMSLVNAFKYLYPTVANDLLEKVIASYREHHHQLEQEASRLFQGVAGGLELIKATGTTIAVATGKRKAGLERSMVANGYNNNNSYFKHCCTADDAASKPDPDMLNQILNKFNLPAGRALMVGDSVHDMAMASNAGMDRVAVTYGAQTADALKQHQPLLVADRFNEFIDWLGLSQHSIGEKGCSWG